MKKANKKELNPFSEIEIQDEFNDDETIFESAENAEEVDFDDETIFESAENAEEVDFDDNEKEETE